MSEKFDTHMARTPEITINDDLNQAAREDRQVPVFVSPDVCRKAWPNNAAFARAFYAELPDGPFRQYLAALTCLPKSG